MTDSAPVTDRRDEIRAGEPFPESARPLLDANGNIVLETRGHPRVDALGRVLGPEAEPDLASAVVKAVYRRLVSIGIVQTNPCRNLDAWVVERSAQRWLTRDEGDVLQAAADRFAHERIGMWVALALGTAARRGEIEAATWGAGSLDTAAGTWTIDKSRVQSTGQIGPTKNGKARRIELPASLATRLRAYRMAMGRPADGEPVVGTLPYDAWLKVRTAVGDPPLKVKDMRNTVLSWALSEGASVVAVAEYAGHDPKVLLDTYARVMPNDSGTVALAIEGEVRPKFAQQG